MTRIPTYGTARVLAAYRDLDMMNQRTVPAAAFAGFSPSRTPTAAGVAPPTRPPASRKPPWPSKCCSTPARDAATAAVNNGLAWLVQQVEAGRLNEPTPIGFYFAKLWYFEKLYPIIFTVAALGRARRKLATIRDR